MRHRDSQVHGSLAIRRVLVVALMLAGISVAGLAAVTAGNPVQVGTGAAVSERRPAQFSVFEGHVFEGNVGDMSRPLEGGVVELFGWDSPYPDLGTRIDWAPTDEDGYYSLFMNSKTFPFEF